jgi:hypothetical protein
MRANDVANFRLRRRRQRKIGQRQGRSLAAIGREAAATIRVPALDWPSDLFADEPLMVDYAETDDVMLVWFGHLAQEIAQVGIVQAGIAQAGIAP